MLRVLAALIEDLGLIHSSTWWHITVCHSSAGELDALHWLPRAPGMYTGVHTE